MNATRTERPEVRRHGVILDRLGSEADDTPGSSSTEPDPGATDEPEPDAAPSLFILAMGGAQYATELAELPFWVTHILLPVHGREIGCTRPWCVKWHEHPNAVARLHTLWPAWQQLTTAEAGHAGPSTWHRDHLDHTLLRLRAPDGPFAVRTTSPSRPAHRSVSGAGR
ncbi:DUF4913 domain-containing protein [Kitasatospora sp. NPDC054795]